MGGRSAAGGTPRFCRMASVPAVLVLIISVSVASASQVERSLLGEPAAACELHGTNNKCTTAPLLVSSLPSPETRSERLMAHYAALAYACGQHKAEPDCTSDRQNSCTYRRDEVSGAPHCVVDPLAVVEHGAEALLCQKSKALAVFRCMLAPRCSADPVCVTTAKGLCVPQFQQNLTGPELTAWEKTFHQGLAEAWGTCAGAVLFRHLFAPCVKHQQRHCLEQPKCEWAPRAGGVLGLCTPKLWMLEPALMGRKDDEFSKAYWAALRVCRNAKAPDCASNLTFTPNPDALATYASFDSITAGLETPLFRGNGSRPFNGTNPKRKHLNPAGGPAKHHHKHPHHQERHKPRHGGSDSQQHASSATNVNMPTAQAGAPTQGSAAPSAGSTALLVIAAIVCIGIVAAAAYIAYSHIRTPKALYHPVESADATEMGPTNLAAKTARAEA